MRPISGWHVLMSLLIVGFAWEMFLLFREIWWLQEATQSQITWVKDWAGQRNEYLRILGHLFWQRLIKYSGAVALLGFGWFNLLWLWTRRICGVTPVMVTEIQPSLYPRLEDVEKNFIEPSPPASNNKERRAAGLFFFLFLTVFRVFTPLISDLVHGALLGNIQVGLYELFGNLVNSALLATSVYIISDHFHRKPVVYLTSVLIIACLFTVIFNAGLWWSTPRLSDNLSQLPGNKFKGIWEVCRRVGFPTSKIFYSSWVNGNAFASGIGPLAHIVIGEDLIADMQPAWLTAIVAHELGHWRYHHVLCTLLILFVGLVAILLVTWLLFTRPPSFGLDTSSTVSRLSHTLCFMFLLSIPLVSILLRPLYNLLSWSMELAADRHAAGLGYAQPLMVALSQLSKYTIGRSINSTLFSIFYSSHPPNNVRFYMLTKLKGIKL